MLIYKIFRPKEWETLVVQEETLGAPIDLADGFIHFSTAQQAAETAAKHFAAEPGLILAAVQSDPLGDDLKWEISRGGAKFPHLYRSLRFNEIAWHASLPVVDGVHQFPDRMV